MNINLLANAVALSDQDLIARLYALALREREATVELVAHLGALDSRPTVYAAKGFGSLFTYCTQALRPSEAVLTMPRPAVQATAPERYRVQFTIGQPTHDKLRRVQALLRREIPDGDPGAIFDRALSLLLETVEKVKLGAVANPREWRSI